MDFSGQQITILKFFSNWKAKFGILNHATWVGYICLLQDPECAMAERRGTEPLGIDPTFTDIPTFSAVFN